MHRLTGKEVFAITQALHVAAEQYNRDAVTTSQTLHTQALQCEELADALEQSDFVEITKNDT